LRSWDGNENIRSQSVSLPGPSGEHTEGMRPVRTGGGIFPAVDGQNLTEPEIRGLVSDQAENLLGKGEIGCALSHLGIYGDMIEKNIPIALVLEDDSVFNHDPRPILAALERQPADTPEVYLLSYCGANRYVAHERTRRQIGDTQFYRGWDGYNANGYVLTKKAAANIRGFQTPIKFHNDWWRIYQLNDLIRFHICEKEIIGLHPELSRGSLLKNEHDAVGDREIKRYKQHLRKQRPLRLRAKYFFFRLRYQFNIRCQ